MNGLGCRVGMPRFSTTHLVVHSLLDSFHWQLIFAPFLDVRRAFEALLRHFQDAEQDIAIEIVSPVFLDFYQFYDIKKSLYQLRVNALFFFLNKISQKKLVIEDFMWNLPNSSFLKNLVQQIILQFYYWLWGKHLHKSGLFAQNDILVYSFHFYEEWSLKKNNWKSKFLQKIKISKIQKRGALAKMQSIVLEMQKC